MLCDQGATELFIDRVAVKGILGLLEGLLEFGELGGGDGLAECVKALRGFERLGWGKEVV